MAKDLEAAIAEACGFRWVQRFWQRRKVESVLAAYELGEGPDDPRAAVAAMPGWDPSYLARPTQGKHAC